MMARGQSERARMFLVDDHPLVRVALNTLILCAGDLAVCGEAADRATALAALPVAKPHVVISGLALREAEGLKLIKDIRRSHPQVRILVLSFQDDIVNAQRAVRAGAAGYVSKEETATKVLEAVRKVLNGEIYWSTKVAAAVASQAIRSTDSPRSATPLDVLSERELEIFELIGEGASMSQISATLRIGPSTVGTHRARIKQKMKLRTGVDLLQAAIGWKLGRSADRLR